jgi:hypothetical protein
VKVTVETVNSHSLNRSIARGPAALANVRRIALPSSARALSTLCPIDYEDAFLVDVGPVGERTPEQWARAIFEDAPIAVRAALVAGWSALGLRLGWRRSDRFVLGWPVRRSDPDFVLLAASSPLGLAAELLLTGHENRLLFATLVQKNNQLIRAVWTGVEPIHGPVVRSALAMASDRERRRRR